MRQQTLGFNCLEVIFADDCSTDASLSTLSRLAEQYTNIKYVKAKQNSGYGGAPRNLALSIARAEYIMFLDADDTFPPDACETLYNAILRENADMATGYCATVDESGNVLQPILPAYEHLQPYKTKLPQELDKELYMRDSFWCRIYKREIIEKHAVKFLECAPAEDIYFLYTYLLHCKSAVYTAKHVYNYEQNSSSVTKNKSASYYIALLSSYYIMQKMFADKGFADKYFIVTDGVLNEHLCALAQSSSINEQELSCVLEKAAWLFDYETENNRLNDYAFLKTVHNLISNNGALFASAALKSLLPIIALQAKAQSAQNDAACLANTLHEIRNSRKYKLVHLFDRRK